jgi:hypothetical protein
MFSDAMDLITAHSGTGLYILGYVVIARRAKLTWKQNIAILGVGYVLYEIFTAVSRLEYWGGIYTVAFVYFAVLARLYWLLGDRWRNTSIRSSTDKCSLGVFMGSGKSITKGKMENLT